MSNDGLPADSPGSLSGIRVDVRTQCTEPEHVVTGQLESLCDQVRTRLQQYIQQQRERPPIEEINVELTGARLTENEHGVKLAVDAHTDIHGAGKAISFDEVWEIPCGAVHTVESRANGVLLLGGIVASVGFLISMGAGVRNALQIVSAVVSLALVAYMARARGKPNLPPGTQLLLLDRGVERAPLNLLAEIDRLNGVTPSSIGSYKSLVGIALAIGALTAVATGISMHVLHPDEMVFIAILWGTATGCLAALSAGCGIVLFASDSFFSSSEGQRLLSLVGTKSTGTARVAATFGFLMTGAMAIFLIVFIITTP